MCFLYFLLVFGPWPWPIVSEKKGQELEVMEVVRGADAHPSIGSYGSLVMAKTSENMLKLLM